MRHRKKNNHLSRKAPHRKAMLANMASSLIIHKRITTTTAKAKALRTFVEPVITRSKEDSTHSRRIAFKHLRDKDAVTELFREVAGKVAERPGGYTRIIKIGNRLGDNADMCIIELVDYNENMLAEKAAAKPKATRRRRSSGKKQEEEPAAVADTEVIDEVADATSEEIPEAEAPETELADAPEAEVPEAPEAEVPEAEAPETEAEVAEAPVAEAETPEAEAPEAEAKKEVKDSEADDESSDEKEKKEE